MDRASAYVDDETLELVRTRVIACGVSLQEDLNSKDPAGDFFRKVVNQRPEPKHSKQGYYIVSPDGTLVKGWMYPRPDDGTVKRNLREALAAYQAPEKIDPLDARQIDRSYKWEAPKDVTVIETRSRVYEANFPKSGVERFDLIRKTMGHDRLWIRKSEIDELAKGSMTDGLLERIVRYHLGDNTRCYLTPWSQGAMKKAQVDLRRDGSGFVLEGSVLVEEGDKGFDAKLYGQIEVKDGALRKFDIVAYGTGWGQHNGVTYFPTGKFTVGNAFTLAHPGVTFDVVPVWSWVGEYMNPKALKIQDVRK